MSEPRPDERGESVAVVGMSGRFPGAADLDAYWRNLRDGVESIASFSAQELAAAGVPPELLEKPRYVRAGAVLRDVDLFDAGLFGFTPREAELMDPQHRLFLESSWEALENAGYDPGRYPGTVGIFGGMGMSKYLLLHLLSHPEVVEEAGSLQLRLLNDKDFLVSTVAFKLGLTGPSVTVQTACSTSLVAVCFACQSLLNYQCDMALAGGITIALPQTTGYLAQDNFLSPDGHCRAFDAGAQGTVEGSGVGLVVLKRLSDALADGDTIHAVITGYAINNDGSHKVGYTAPNPDAQAEVVAMAQAMAGAAPESITYVETHGTGTPLGDTIEVSALSRVFAEGTDRKGFCALGSVKTNIGHLDAAAGVAGLIKTVLALEHGLLPPSLHFRVPNPRIDFAGSPFFVNAELRPWRPDGGLPRRAGVSSFSMGGANAHVVLEEAPAVEPPPAALPWDLLVLSARSQTALTALAARLADHLERHPGLELADVAHTLQQGRRALPWRRVVAARDTADAVAALRDPQRGLTAAAPEPRERPVVFLCSGQGSQYLGMGRDLYREEPVFRREINRCAALLEPRLGLALRRAVDPEAETPEAVALLARTELAQPALFAVEVAVARLWIERGIAPAALLGHSIGEYVAACLAGVMTLEEGLALVAERGRLLQELPGGAMLAVDLPEPEIAPWLRGGLSLAAVNEPSRCVVSGAEAAVEDLARRLAEQGVGCRRLATFHAFHSAMMDPVLDRFAAAVARVRLQPPRIPFVSNLTGTWIRDEEATDPAYWAAHLRQTVRFADGLSTLLREGDPVLLEVGPGNTLSALARRQAPGCVALSSLRHPREQVSDVAFLLTALGRLWLAGQEIEWPRRHPGQRRRVPLPAYPFERQSHWIEPRRAVSGVSASVPVAAAIAPCHERPSLPNDYAAPRGSVEERLVDLWQQVLGIGRVGIHDDLFELGGHSLLGTQLLARVRAAFDVEIPLEAFFKAPTVAALAAVVAAEQARRDRWDRRDDGPGTTIPRRVPGSGTAPLSFAQERLWFIDQLEPGDPAYNVPAAVLLTGALDLRALAASLDEVVARHEALRTTFGPVEEPAQRIAPPAPVPFPRVDLDGLPPARREDEARRLAREEALGPFDLAWGPLLRAALLRLGHDRHVALLTLHHIVSDGWSVGVLVRELAALYAAFAAGRPSPLAPLPVQYADFARWQRDALRGAELESQLAFWRQALAGAPPALELPADRPRPARMSGRGGLRWRPVAAERAQALAELGRRPGATPFMTLLAVFFSLLHRYTGETDLVVGTPIANRSRPELEGLIGFFVNTLVLRATLPSEPTFAGLLARVREGALAAYAHQDLPFERLVEELAPERSLARTPLFQVMFLLHGTAFDAAELPGLALAPFGGLEPDGRAARFDLTLELVESGPELLALLEFRRDLFDGETASRMLEHFAALTESVAVDPGGRLAELPLLLTAERDQLLTEWNATGRPVPAGCIHEWIAAQAARTPEAVAVVFGSESLTYRQLDQRANGLALRLRRLGVGAEVRVGILLERSLNMLVGLLAVLKAGGAYVPLDPFYPAERLAFMREDSVVATVLTGESFSASLPEVAAAPESGAGSQHTAYVIYTSGSTGRPKGVQIPHGALANFLAAMAERPGLGAGDRLLAVTSLSFDIAGLELFLPLILGGRVVLASREDTTDGRRLQALIMESGATVLQATPATWRLLLESGWQGGEGLKALCGGESLTPALATALLQRVGSLWNVYGPTETTVWSTVEEIRDDAGANPFIGQPIANTEAYVLDGAGNLSPVGVPGELLLGGAGLARGYLSRPELTAEKFVPNPFGDTGSRLYRTGDLARWRPNGALECLGRIDHQVKVRGFRIELGEIESVLDRCSGIREAVVVVREDTPGERRLVAYVAGSGEMPDAGELRRFLGSKLPDPMVPSAFVTLSTLPRTPNGKVDRRALPAPDRAGREEDTPPRTPMEEVVAGIFSQILGVERVGAQESFFALGGHSLLATRVMARVRQTFGLELPLRAIFEASTLEGFAGRVEAALRAGAGLITPPFVPVPRDRELPLSFAQQRLWFLDQLDPGGATYNIPSPVRLTGDLDVAALAASLREVVARHEVLRTTFVAGGQGEAVQRIAPSPALDLPLLDLSVLPAALGEAESQRLAREEASRPFDLARGPLVRSLLVRLSEGEHLVLLTLHHIVSDGWSSGILVRELTALYPAFAAGRPSPLPGLPVQYADFAVWQREWLRGEVLDDQLRFWREWLAGAPPVLELPADRPRPAMPSGRGGTVSAGLPAGLEASLSALRRRSGATRFMVLLAAWKALLHRLTDRADLVVGTPVANRGRIELEGLIGFFANTLVLRTDLGSSRPEGLGFEELIARVRESALAAYAHQDLPFEKLVEELAPERSLSHAPLFQVMFQVEDAPLQPVELSGLALAPLALPGGTAKFDLTLTVQQTAGRLLSTIEYSTDLFDAATVRRWLGELERLIAAALAAPEQGLAGLPLLSAAEAHQLRNEWNAGAAGPEEPACLHELFERQAARRPGAVALLCGGRELTYGELARRAESLAGALRQLGVGPEVRVGVFLDRSPEMVAALLGILKAGGAYVPLDPVYPVERVALMLADSGAAVVVTRPGLAARLGGAPVEILCLGEGETEVPAAMAATGVSPSNLAYVIYTSGSTGRPKGVAIEHQSAVSLVRWARQIYSDEDLSGVLASTSLSFDLSVFELFVPLSWGGRVVLVDDVLELPRLDADAGVRLVNTVPSAAAELVGLGGWPSTVRTVNLAGEPLRGELARRLAAEAGIVRIYNLYGPSEDTTYSTFCQTREGEGEPTIGRSLSGRRACVVDPALGLSPLGVPGEILLGGPGVARGYLGRPELTAERFVPDPFSGEAGARLYRTGDLARRRPDGELELLGRIDHQVKVRGFRIELGEIETVLGRYPGVREAIVAVREDAPGDRRLVGYVAGSGELPDAGELRRFLGAKLPGHMVPSAFVILSALPRTPNGKVDRRALPAPDRHGPEGDIPPRTPMEELIGGIYSQLLGVERVGAQADFFVLGGHSLLATRLVSHLRVALGVELTLRGLFEQPTVAGVAARVEEARREGAGPAAPPIVPASREGDLPLSFAQQRLWFLDQLEPGSSAYHIPAAVRLTGPLRPAVLAASLDALAARHEALRTTFDQVNSSPVQRVAPPGRQLLSYLDLGGLPQRAREAEARRLTGEESLRPFDLRRGPLLRSLLLRLGVDEHVLVLVQHHVLSDDWSMGVLIRELTALYQAGQEGHPSPLPGLPVQYADFAVWQRSWLRGAVLEGELAWWRSELSGCPQVLELPADRPRPPVLSGRGRTEEVALPVELSRELAGLSQSLGATLFMSLLAVFQTLLSRWSGQEELLVGTPIANRNRAEIESLIGFFVNTLVLRGRVEARASFPELVRQARERALSAYAHQDLPFEALVETLQPERDPSRSPLFQVMFALQNAGVAGPELHDLAVSVVRIEAQATKFDLSLSLRDDPAGLAGTLTYSTDLFDRATMVRLLGHFRSLLEGVIADPLRPLAGISPWAAAERHQVLLEWNDSLRPLPGHCLHQLFEAQVERTPGAPAVVFEGEVVSYGELNRQANRVAYRLRRLGVGPEVKVVLSVRRSPAMVAGALGILKAGGAYVPVEPDAPRERLALILKDLEQGGEPPVVVTREWLDEARSAPHAKEENNPESGVVPANAVYLIYTSGSTGLPKAVEVEHRHLVNYLDGVVAQLGLGEGAGYALLQPLSVDACKTALYPPLLSGGTVHVISEERALDGPWLAEYLRQHRLEVLKLAPSHLMALQSATPPGSLVPEEWLILGGEASRRDWILGLREQGGCRILHQYGPTETTVAVLACRIEPELAGGASQTTPLGRPLPNSRVYVLDPAQRPVPLGVAGELCVAGAGVARGYFGRPALTGEKFVPDPFGERGSRLYRTGDLARHLPGGELEFLGRIDHQVKVRGFRVELGEIEAALGRHPAVGEAVVVGREGPAGGVQLVAYLTARGETPPTAEPLRSFLRERLPAHMVPSSLVVLASLPRTAHGKLDRKALARIIPAPEIASGAGAMPATPVEELLAGTFAELLGRERVAIHEDFFALGGHSLLAIRLASRVRESFGIEMPLRELFEHPTVAGLAAAIQESQQSGQRSALPAIVPIPRDGTPPLSFAQRRLWLLDQPDPGSTANISSPVPLTGDLDAAVLAASLREVVARHEALRTAFEAGRQGKAVQRIALPPAFDLPLLDLSALPAVLGEAESRRLAREEEARPFDLARGPLVRSLLVRLSEGEHLVLLTLSHLVSDGWSSGILMRELERSIRR